MRVFHKDVVIVGSGFGASPPAWRLAQAGWDVIMIEKGPAIDPYGDFKQTQDPKYLLRYLKTLPGIDVSINYVEGLGGGSGLYEHISLRAPSLIFEEKDSDGNQLWPSEVTRQTLDPYYELSERTLKVKQIPEKAVPKTGQVFSLIMKKLGFSVERSRYAVENCMDCGRCITGCIYGAKQSLLLNYIPSAQEAGCQIATDTEVIGIKPLGIPRASLGSTNISELPFRFEVLTRSNGKEGLEASFRAKMVVLAGGTLGTARLLLRSQDALVKISPQLGKNVTYNGMVKCLCLLPDWCPDVDLFVGRSNPGILSYQFLKSHNFLLTTSNLLPLQLFANYRVSDPKSKEPSFWGRDHVLLMKTLRTRVLPIVALGKGKPINRLTLANDGQLEFHCGSKAYNRKFERKGKSILSYIIRKSGGKMLNLIPINRKGMLFDDVHYTSSHPMGACKMADSAERGVVDYRGEVFGYPGLFITDGSVISGPLIVNPSLTILANSERITDLLLERFKN
jgi:choline dehydrogenase-like flavoprotein